MSRAVRKRTGRSCTVAIAAVVALIAIACGETGEDPMRPPPSPPPEPPPGPVVPDPVYAFVGVDVIVADGTESVLSAQTVLVAGDEILEVGSVDQVNVPTSATVIDGSGLYLAPGLTDFHVHVTVGSADAAAEQGVLFVANGVTAILNMGDVGINGDIRDYRHSYLTGTPPGPTMYTGKFARGVEDGGSQFGLVVTSPTQATSFVRRAKADGYDFIKVYNWLRRPVWDALMREGEVQGMPVIGHVPLFVPIRDALRQGQRMIAHASEYYWSHYDTLPNHSLTQSAVDQTTAAGTWVTPTLSASESVTQAFGNNGSGYAQLIRRESFRYQHPDIKAHWRTWLNNGDVPGARNHWVPFMQQFINEFHSGGVRLLIGTDAPDVVGLGSGFGVYEEFRLLEAAGLTRSAILGIATRNAGDFIAETLPSAQPFGRIEPGYRADLLLLRESPFEDLAHLKSREGVMVRGRWWPQAELDAAIEAIAQRNSP